MVLSSPAPMMDIFLDTASVVVQVALPTGTSTVSPSLAAETATPTSTRETLAALMVAFNSLDLAYVTALLGRILLFLPKVMVAVVILFFGAYFARLVGAALTTYLHNIGVGEAGLVGRIALYAIMIFVIMIALDQMGLGDIIRQTFLIIIAAIGLGLALRFGLGGQKRAPEMIERRTRKSAEGQAARDRAKKPVL